MKKILLFIGIPLLLLIGVFLYENSYNMKESTKIIHATSTPLNAFIAKPNHGTKQQGLVVFVHGDGPMDATQDGGYKPLMEKFAESGYTSISWDKPGIGKSQGNWLNQSMDDRATEVNDVITWAKQHPNINTDKIVLWGSSQAGWVIPKVMASGEHKFALTILASPAINWIEQGQFNTQQELQNEGKTAQQIKTTTKKDQEILTLLNNNSSYSAYQKIAPKENPMTKDRWQFVQKNYLSDATADLKKITTPVLLLLAEKDRNVDIQDTKQVYTQTIPKKLLTTVTIKNTQHAMLNPQIANSKWLTTLTAIMAPKDQLLDKDYLNICQKSLNQLNKNKD
ncbi:alpha/beta hydrolase family protein [Listeria rustica]|uniref:Prolyl oligopeptidase family serine peptidase n=1 Tax=Listeria rustica TaxID=2713503 RepID=A0A7W1T5R1_9LIST|nr:alpha/beta fold hydrolase [Listeria rustica]MBA3925917.1 prolyl oligopeptidase family serine peptidase [Listeria rustica]